MTGQLPQPADRDRYESLLRERYGDPASLARERDRPVPLPPSMSIGAHRHAQPREQRPQRASYAAQHAELRAWIHRDHPSWLPELHTLGDSLAHVIIQRSSPTFALALCGESGPPHAAPEISQPCRDCASFRPRRRSSA